MAKAFQRSANELTPPRWAGDFISPDRLIPGGARLDPALFFIETSVLVKLSAAAAADAVAIVFDALTGPIPSGTRLYFGQSKEFALTTAAAAAGAVTVAVEALPSALEDNDEARYDGDVGVRGFKVVPSGTFVGRTFAERDANTPYGPWTAGDDEAYLIPWGVSDADGNPDIELYRHGNVVKENYLPDFATIPAGNLTRIRELYVCIKGVD